MSDKSCYLSEPATSALFPDDGRQLPDPAVSEPTRAQIEGAALPDFPLYLAVEVTNACNLACEHCNYRYGLPHYTRDRGFMTEAMFSQILDEAAIHNTTLLLNYDGEPMLHPKYVKFLRMATNKGLNSYFNTNATLMTRERAAEITSFYRGSIFFSIDGNRHWFEKIRKPASYDQVVGNVFAFLEENEKRGWPVTVCVNFCNLGQTAKEREDFVAEWLPRVNYVSIGETNDKFGTCVSDKITRIPLKKRPVCVVPWMTCGIAHNGDVIPCSIHITRANTTNAIFGNIGSSSIAEIWKNESFSAFRAMLASGSIQGTYCEKCERWLSQFLFPDEQRGNATVRRNGFWTTFQNNDKGSLNFLG